MATDDAPLLWDDDAFRAQVIRLAGDRGRTITDVCRSAGLSASYLARSAGKSGRSIEALLAVAETLEVSLIELIGVSNHHDGRPTDDNLARLALVYDVASHLYIALGARRQIPSSPSNVAVLVGALMRMIEAPKLPTD